MDENLTKRLFLLLRNVWISDQVTQILPFQPDDNTFGPNSNIDALSPIWESQRATHLRLEEIEIRFRCGGRGLQAKGAQKEASSDEKRGEKHGRLAEGHLHYKPATDSLRLLTHTLGALESWICAKALDFSRFQSLDKLDKPPRFPLPFRYWEVR